MKIGLVVLLYAAVVAVMAIAAAFAVSAERHASSEKYDEMQKINRGNAYRFSFHVGLVYYFLLMVYFIFHTGKGAWVIEPFVLLLIGIIIQMDSFHIYCLMTHSALPLGEKPLPTIIGYLLLGTMYLVQYFGLYIPEEEAAAAGVSGALSYNLLRLVIALSFISLAVLHLIACLRNEKE